MIQPPSLLLEPEARGLLVQALENCGKKSFGGVDALVAALRAGEPWAHSLFRYALAQELGLYLNRICPNIRRVYVYGSTMDDRAGPSSDVDLILWVREKVPALESLLWKLDALLLHGYRMLTGFSGPPMFFDLHIVDDAEVAERQGYGAVIHSLWTAPVPLQLPEEARNRERTSLT